MSLDLPFTLHPRKTKMFGLLLLCSLFTALGAWIGLNGKTAGWFCGGFFALGIPIFLIQMHPRAAFLTLSEEGLEWSSLFMTSRLRWSDISEFGTYSLRQNGLLVATRVGLNFSPTYQGSHKMRGVSKAVVGYESGLPDTYGLRPEELAQLLASFHAEHAPQVGSNRAPSLPPRSGRGSS